MFLCDFVCLLICIVGFNQFGTSQAPNANVVSLLQDNRVPLPFVLLLLAQFILIIIDRALYLRHSQMGKVVFHYLLIVAVHAYVVKWILQKNQRNTKKSSSFLVFRPPCNHGSTSCPKFSRQTLVCSQVCLLSSVCLADTSRISCPDIGKFLDKIIWDVQQSSIPSFYGHPISL